MEALWQERVGEEFDRITRENEEQQRQEVSKAWRCNRAKIDEACKQETVSVATCKIPETKSQCSKGKRKLATLWTGGVGLGDNAMKKQQVEILEIPVCKSLPVMRQWTPIQRNILMEDSDQGNIPYFSDEVIDKDAKFIQTFEEEVNKKINNNDNITDEMFLSLVSSLSRYSNHTDGEEDGGKSKYVVLFKPTSSSETNWIQISRGDSSLPGLIVFQAISSKFPEYGNTEQLIVKYKHLTAQKVKPDFVANIDGERAESVSAERAMQSYKLLLCRRCFVYDCQLHNDLKVEEPVPRLQKEKDLALPTSPCGKYCFRHLSRSSTSISPPETFPIQSQTLLLGSGLGDLLEQTPTFQKETWTGGEQTFFRVLTRSFASNWCLIAQIMITKKCCQVYQFSLHDIETSIAGSDISGEQVEKKSSPGRKQHKKMDNLKTMGGDGQNKRAYSPCHHPGTLCRKDSCSCIQDGNFCEKYCYCPIDCHHRFPGCKCKKDCVSRSCCCYRAARECDPDLCNICTDSCRNMVIQQTLEKKVYMAPSDIAGWGCFIGEKAIKNEFIAEYVGEMISQEEAERRGKVYDKEKCSYIFNLNEDYCIDAARMGSKIRFANHSSKPNCMVRIMMVAGDHRIGLYANRNIEEGEELFFDYGEDFKGHDIV